MHICQILLVVFESASHFSFKFCNFAFLTWNIIYFGQRSQLKSNCFRFSSARVKIVKFLSFEMTSQNFSIFALFFIAWHITPLQILRPYLFYFGWKDLIKVPILILSSALVKICQISQIFFSNHKWVFLQNLYLSSVSQKITHLYFCSSNKVYFGHKEPIKTQIF